MRPTPGEALMDLARSRAGPKMGAQENASGDNWDKQMAKAIAGPKMGAHRDKRVAKARAGPQMGAHWDKRVAEARAGLTTTKVCLIDNRLWLGICFVFLFLFLAALAAPG